MSTENLNRTSEEIKIPDAHLDVLSKDKIDQNRKKKRTCINALNQKLYVEQKKDKAKNTFFICVVIISVGLFGLTVT
tara:strand:- start:184 stop:414 length:231 start_codon:yes stop_codon:yes gene_type:complete